MQRRELISAIQQIAAQLDKTELFNASEKYRDNMHKSTQAPYIPNLLRALRDFSYWSRGAPPAVHKVLAAVGLTELDDIELWTYLAKAEPVDARFGLKLVRPLFYARTILPNLIPLLERDSDRLIEHPEQLRNRSILRIIAIETGTTLSKPRRIVAIIEAVSALYEACAILEGSADDDLSILACDSGSDKSFDFLGLAKVIECVKTVILSLWDKVVFFRERKLAAKLELIGDSLPVFDKINNMEATNAISREQAEILRRGIAANLESLLNAGILIPEIEVGTIHDPRRLMAPEPKLLTAGSPLQGASTPTIEKPSETRLPTPTVEKPNETAPPDDNLTVEEQAVFNKLLSKSQRKKKT
jgi:hypothetical protein